MDIEGNNYIVMELMSKGSVKDIASSGLYNLSQYELMSMYVF